MQKLRFVNGNGVEIDLTAGRYGVTEWSGFSNADLNIQSQQVPFQDGAVFLDALYNPRELSITLAINDENDLEKRYELKRELISVMNAKLGEGYLYYKNDFIEKRIKVIPQLPIFENKNSNNSGTLKASLTWTAPEVYWEDEEEKITNISIKELSIIDNKGDIPIQIKANIFSEFVKSPELLNLTSGKKIKYNGILNKSLYIDTNVGNKKVLSQEISQKISSINVNLNSIVYSRKLNLFVAVGNSGIIYNSFDGINWSKIQSPTSNLLFAITYSEELNLFVAVGTNAILTSPDGINWTSRISFISLTNLRGVSYSSELNLFVAVGWNGHILTSPDGINWTSRDIEGIYNNFGAVTYSSELNLFVIVGNNGTFLTSPDGIDWTSRLNGIDNDFYFYGVIYSSELNLFMAVGWSGTVLTSPDGINWTSRTSGTNNDLMRIFYSSELNLFIIVGRNRTILTSPDGINWTSRDSTITQPTYTTLSDIAYNSAVNIVIIVGDGYILKSPDGINWTKENENPVDINSIIYSRKLDLFVAVGNSGIILTSPDGINWESLLPKITLQNIYNVTYSEELNLFVAVGYNIILTSSDGIDWTSREIPSTLNKNARAVTYSEELNLFVAVGFSGLILISPDGINWTEIPNIYSNHLYDVIYSRKLNLFVVIGNNIVLKSSDGINWEYVLYSSSYGGNSIAYSEELNLFVVVTNSGQVSTSPDGINWEYLESGAITNQHLYDVIYSSELNMFIAVGGSGTGSGGVVFTSFDGKNWEDKSFIDIQFNSICYNNKTQEFIVVGSKETIIILDYEYLQNQISKTTIDSDMNLNLQVGKNKMQFNYEEGNATCRVTYRQKYLGV